ncbi:helix-turn-helix transcriptional regulator [Microbacterium sp.]|uniref:helix-turn-helix transcriptional regulator n=1 Tax=Microbacterium sp. TaxID=51671 RepID=UPI003A8E63FD
MASSPPALSSSAREDLRESFAELRSISAAVADASLRTRLARLEQKLIAVAGESRTTVAGPATRSVPAVRLSRREMDVLSCVALGHTNAEIAAQLSLREGTVKAYLGTAMSKLDASTRHAAVARARRAGILP